MHTISRVYMLLHSHPCTTHTLTLYLHAVMCTHSRAYTLAVVHTGTHTRARSAQALPLFVGDEHIFMDLEQKLSKYFSKDWKRETRGVSQRAGREAGLLALEGPVPRVVAWSRP